MNRKVSVIMPCYNQGEFVIESIKSVERQTYKTWELIIVNDGSSDDTHSIVMDYIDERKSSNILYFQNENMGVSYTRNFAIEKSTGEYILPLDADDIIDSTFLEKSVKVLSSKKSISIVYSDVKLFGSENKVLNIPPFNIKKILIGNYIVCTALFRKSDFNKTTGYDQSFNNGWEDWDFWLTLLGDGSKAYLIPEVLFFYRIKEVSRNANFNRNKSWQIEAKWGLFQKHIELYKQHFNNPLDIIKEVDYLRMKIQYAHENTIKFLLNRSSLYQAFRRRFYQKKEKPRMKD